MKKHECREDKDCCCSIIGLEPDEDCPVHSAGPWPPKCGICGRFMKWDTRQQEYETLTLDTKQPLA